LNRNLWLSHHGIFMKKKQQQGVQRQSSTGFKISMDSSLNLSKCRMSHFLHFLSKEKAQMRV